MDNFKIQDLQAALSKHKLSLEEYEKIKDILKREPNLIELGIFSAMWSEHCSYKSSKIYLKDFPIKQEWVIQGPGENAGVIDIGDNLAAVFKIESHNHPSFIEPNAGAATGVGGILRDIFTMGADPIVNLNSIRFGDILDSNFSRKHKFLLHGVVEGIGHYGNCMGIPTIGGETSFESCYNGNILVNAFSLGIAHKDKIFYGKASGEGNPVIYVGSKTGRDGLGGAVMSSDSFDSKSKELKPTVQIGDPFIEKLLLEACLEVFREDLIIGIQDMGAAGLTSSSFEMASRSNSGMIMYLDKIPTREELNPYQLMLSESQERMLLCAKKGCEDRIKEIFKKYELDAEIVGEVRNTGKMELFWRGEKCAELEIKPIVDNAPILNREVKIPKYLDECKNIELIDSNSYDFTKQECKDNVILNKIFKEMLSSLDICDKSWIYDQYDSSIKASTIRGPGLGDSSIISLKNYNSNRALSFSVKCNVRYCYLNPFIGAQIAVMQTGRNVALSGAKPLAITDCLNFGSPENPEVMYQFREVCEGIKKAAKVLKTPVVSGNVSFYNQTNDTAIYPSPTIVNVGVIENYNLAIKSAFVKEDSIICMIGTPLNIDFNHFSGSLFQKIIGSKISGIIHEVDLESELRLWEFLQDSIAKKYILSAKDIGQGGLAIALAKMAIIGNMGINIESKIQNLNLFAEYQTEIICEVEAKNVEFLRDLSYKSGLNFDVIGKTCSNDAIKIDCLQITLKEASELYFNSFTKKLDI